MNKLTFSVLLVGLFAAVTLASNAPQVRRPFKFSPGQTYIYEYRGRQWNGLSKLADQYAGLTLECDVIFQALTGSQGEEVVLKLDDIKVEQLHTQALANNDIRKLNPGQEQSARQTSLYREELSKPIRFTYVNGKVVRFFAQTDDAEWSINIKKSILSLFQLDIAPTKIIKSPIKLSDEQKQGFLSEEIIEKTVEMPLVYSTYEESFGGICETDYQIDSAENADNQQELINYDALNVTKTVNYKNCLTDPSVSYERHSFDPNTQTSRGKQMHPQPSFTQANYYPVPEELKAKYSNVYTAEDGQDNVAAMSPVSRQSYTKYNMSSTSSHHQSMSGSLASPIIEGIYSEAKIKYDADGDMLMSDTQQTLKLISFAPTAELARAIPEVAGQTVAGPREPTTEFHTIQLELNSQKVKFYQALWKFAQLQQNYNKQPAGTHPLFSHQLTLPFALSASWYPIVASGQQTAEQPIERVIEPEQLAKNYEQLLVSLAEDVITEDVAQSKEAGEKVVRLVNIVAFMPKHKLAQVYQSIVERIHSAKKQQVDSRGKQAVVDDETVTKYKVVRKLFLDSLPLAGSKQAVDMIETLITGQQCKPYEARELCEAVPANIRYPDTEIIGAFIRISQLPQVRNNRALFASCSIAAGKLIGQAYAKSDDASYKPTTYDSANKLPAHLRDDEIVRQVVEEADPRRNLPIDWSSQDNQELYDRLVVGPKDISKYIILFKQLLYSTSQYHEKVIYIETLAHMKLPMVLPILETYATGRLSLNQCLGAEPLDVNRQRYQQSSTNTGKHSEDAAKDWTKDQAYGAEECNYMRTIAIYSMAHLTRVAPSKVQAILLPIFENTYEPYQLRIAAFTTLMLTPVPEHTLERIASQMWREPSKEVVSFVVGTVDTMSKMTSPAMAKWKWAAMKAADSMPKQYLDTWKHSWLAGGDHFNMQKQTGSVWVSEIIKSNVSSIPRAAYAHYGRYHGQTGTKFDNMFELGFTAKGLESLLKQYIAYNKQQEETGSADTNIVAAIFESLYDAKEDIVKYYREARDQIKQSLLNDDQKSTSSDSFVQNYFFKRQQPIDGVNSGKQNGESLFDSIRPKRSVTFNARSTTEDNEEAKLTIFSKLFDSTSYHALDKKQIIELLEQSDDYIKMVADELIAGGKLHYVKMISPNNMWHMVPSQIGLPVIVTHRTPIVISLKIDGSNNGQLTSNKMSQYLRQQVTGSQVPNVQGHNYASKQGLNITALVHPKIMHSSYRFLFAVEQANCDAYGVHTEKSHQLSLPLEVSVAFNPYKQRASIQIQPKTPARIIWTKEVGKTFIGQVTLATQSSDKWLGREQMIRVPSSEHNQLKRLNHPEMYVPSILSSIQSLINEPKENQKAAIAELQTASKFYNRFVQPMLGLEFDLEGATDDEEIVRVIAQPETTGHYQTSRTEQTDELEQHSKSGPMSQLLHVYESAVSRPSKYLEFYTTIKPIQPNDTPVYRFDFVLDGPQQGQKLHQYTQTINRMGRRPTSSRYPTGTQTNSAGLDYVNQARITNEIRQQQIMLNGY